MAESKLLDDDKDEWFYQTMNKYSNLYMFELEFPLETIEVINEASLCITGLQPNSKKCEILQLCVPPKLLRSEDEEGLCKDRDFKILSGGYSDGKIRQTKGIQKSENLIATYQDGYSGIIIYEVGDNERATILEKQRLPTSSSLAGTGKSLCSMNDSLVLAMAPSDESTNCAGIFLNEWKLDCGLGSSSVPPKSYNIWKTLDESRLGCVTKLKSWEDNSTCIFLTSRGTVALYDFRTGLETPSLFFHATKSANNPAVPLTTPSSSLPIVFTFDCLPQHNKIGVLDSCGGYETFDPRYIAKTGISSSSSDAAASSSSRCLLPEFSDLAGVYRDWFNIEYKERTKMRENEITPPRFIISGLKRECVPVFQEVSSSSDNPPPAETVSTTHIAEKQNNSNAEPVFSHDGHSKSVSHSIWHPVAKDLVFSASVDAVLHAWQFIPDKIE